MVFEGVFHQGIHDSAFFLGIVGARGEKGDLGEKGEKGDRGPIGPKGDSGFGSNSRVGARGDKVCVTLQSICS